MRKVIGAINMTLDGDCNHTSGIADDEIHQHYSELLRHAGVILYGRITYQLMEYWPTIVKHPTGHPAMDEFALIMDEIPKIVFSHSLTKLDWPTAKLATRSLEEEIVALKQEPGKDILIGSRSLIIAALNLGLIDEFQLCVQPTISGGGIPLFKEITNRINLKLIKTKTLSSSGSVVFYYGMKDH